MNDEVSEDDRRRCSKKVQLTGVITPYQLHFYGNMGLSQQRLWQPSLIDENPALWPDFSYFCFAFGKLSGLNLVIKKSAVDLAK